MDLVQIFIFSDWHIYTHPMYCVSSHLTRLWIILNMNKALNSVSVIIQNFFLISFTFILLYLFVGVILVCENYIIYKNFTSFNQILYIVIFIKCLVDIEKTLLQLNESCYSLQWNFILLLCKWFFLVALYFWDRIFFVRDHRILFAIMRILTSNYFIVDSLAQTSPSLEIF